MKTRDTFYWAFPTNSMVDYVIINKQIWYTAASLKRYLHTNTNTATLLLTLPENYRHKKAYVGKTDISLSYRLKIFWSILFDEEAVKYMCRRRKYPYPDLTPLEFPEDIPNNQYTITDSQIREIKERKERQKKRQEADPLW